MSFLLGIRGLLNYFKAEEVKKTKLQAIMKLCEKSVTTKMISAKSFTYLEVKLVQIVNTVKVKRSKYLIIKKHQFYKEKGCCSITVI